MRKHLKILIASGAAIALAACGQPDRAADSGAGVSGPAAVDDARLLNAASEPDQWLTLSGTYLEQRYSTLNQINTENVSELGLAWFDNYDGKTAKVMQEGTPLFVDGVLYVSTAWSNVYAYDVRTGERLWRFDPEVPNEWAVNVCCGLVNRGIAAYDGKIYVGTLDGRLIAIDAGTGESVWETMTIDQSQPYSITGPVRVAKGQVLVGNSGAEFGVRGYLSAYDAQTGEQNWRFYTVPGNPADGFENEAMEMAAETWTGEWWRVGGGGTVWDGVTYDPVTNLIYIGVGNGSPWSAVHRSPDGGDNLFLSSIVAVDADTGEYRWHYQTTPWETWDYTATQQMTVAELELDGEQRRVVMQAPKNGFLYVIDAWTGELLRANPFTEVNWASHVDLETGRPQIYPEARYDVTGEPFNSLPGPQGARGWHPVAYSPETELIYLPVQEAWFYWVYEPDWRPQETGLNLGVAFPAMAPPGTPSGFQGHLRAMNPDTGEIVWESDYNQGPTGGALATAGGLVFQGNGAGQEFRAFDKRTGEKLWSMDAQTGVFAGPITFELDGEQYIAVSVGANDQSDYFAPTYGRMLVFKRGGTVQLPERQPHTPRELNPPPLASVNENLIQVGASHYSTLCATCHGPNADGRTRGEVFPDLTRTPLLHTQEGFDVVVLEGLREEQGMVGFANELSAEDSEALRAYLVSVAQEALTRPAFGGFGGGGGGGGGQGQAPAADADADAEEPAGDGIHQQ